ncbi:MAG: hypothetical protein LQ337_001456 [Flavoplaca oasis]|nr:MAG: hypothetical protein LQ337_001456 [Flavoplaca oasis]
MDDSGFHSRDAPKQVGAGLENPKGVVPLDRTETDDLWKFAIGQRAMLLETANGNVLWDLITLLDTATIKSRGGLEAIIISHSHYYTTYCDWAKAFDCPVYISSDDQQWLCRRDPSKTEIIKFVEPPAPAEQTILPGVTAIKTGGHFPGSLVLHWDHQLFIADTIMTVPVALPLPEEKGNNRFSYNVTIKEN